MGTAPSHWHQLSSSFFAMNLAVGMGRTKKSETNLDGCDCWNSRGIHDRSVPLCLRLILVLGGATAHGFYVEDMDQFFLALKEC